MKRRLTFLLLATGALALLPGGTASAHPLGNFTVNRYDGLVAAPGELRVDHVEDLAEIPATQAGPDLKRLGTTAWAHQRCARAAEGSGLTVDGRTATLTAVGGTARLRPGQAGLHTLRVECRLTAPLPRGATVTVGFHSADGTGGPGWREITARGDRMTLTATDVPKSSVSHELTTYPKDLLSSPADTTAASLRLRPGGPALAEERQAAPGAAVLPRGADRWTRELDDLVARRDLTVGFAALALLIAVVLGALHALAPGHGKTLMAAAAAARGGRARPRDVLPLAASVTVTHTLGVVALGLLVTAGSAATPSVIAWLGIAGGALVLAAGANLVRRVWSSRHHDHHHHPPHPVEHTHEGHTHTHTHTHGGHTHTHPAAPTVRGTILLGFAGGLVPSPSAVVVLVGAAALGKAWFGLLLVVAYGAGLALTLTAAGFAVVRLGSGVTRALERRPRWTTHPVTALVRRSVPLVSALVVMALGAGLVLKGAASALG
ncbi:nickel transporter [Streptomyces fodineus]|uniref:Nickel transporter n=1 Tax=Streptomyces fodineus TaxID=1904616 RepID=A0A1D7YI40_9ACTN|nr:sulfite exporter TauE/SafE family protein [Streptomyces fodineus]AOR35216.1 nickel transporter [Streptomyces fodineus]